jgi:hypothetical protein
MKQASTVGLPYDLTLEITMIQNTASSDVLAMIGISTAALFGH